MFDLQSIAILTLNFLLEIIPQFLGSLIIEAIEIEDFICGISNNILLIK
jgi:hypothetical protein